ncbi:hypothetical protein [Pelosinus propionicus]|uniref:Uncharacterized protein n=1 Tax=Pelosinus propionicus DSM 13327 TaxID=1123291 RepID=A0A1I4L6G1_9FIRM|nr:hypothetical protein [Pelosinus propionicus]SFL86459.1 hypothetical protein SAMN04490355_102271 [Pelosinus propionicus DSM 13327]
MAQVMLLVCLSMQAMIYHTLLFQKLLEMKFAQRDDSIASVSLFGFPEKISYQGPETLARIKKELL